MHHIEQQLREWNRLYSELAVAERALSDGTVAPGGAPYERLRDRVAALQRQSDVALHDLHTKLAARRGATH